MKFIVKDRRKFNRAILILLIVIQILITCPYSLRSKRNSLGKEGRMLIKLLGWFWIITGILFFLKPEMLRRRLQKKTLKNLKKYLFLIVITLSIFLISAAWRSEGLLSKVVMVLGIIGIFKGFFLLKAKAAEKILGWFIKQPSIFFRFGASLQIIIGIIILKM
jgi:hypothetical protein